MSAAVVGEGAFAQPMTLAPGTSGLYDVTTGATALDMRQDLDTDGYADLVVGDGSSQVAAVFAGAVHVYSGRTGQLLYELFGPQAKAWLGNTVSTCQDLDGDGIADVLAGAPFITDVTASPGLVYVISGATGTVLYILQGVQFAEVFGATVAGGGDVDGDGFGDFCVHSTGYDAGSKFQAGTVRVFSGLTGALQYQIDGTQSGETYGEALDMAGDADGDGISDLLIGSRSWGVGILSSAGLAEVRSGPDGALRFSDTGERRNDYLGFRVAFVGDLNGDGNGEIAYSAIGQDVADQVDVGEVYVLDPSVWATVFTLVGSGPGSSLGSGLETAGDVQGDSVPDLLVVQNDTSGAGSNLVDLVDGALGVIVGFFQDAFSSGFGAQLAGGSDLTGDGLADLSIRGAGVVHAIQANSLSVSGNPLPGGTISFDHNAPAGAGDPFLVLLSFGTAGVPFGGRTIPLSPDPLFLVSFGAPGLGGVLDAGGAASVPFSIPANPNLSGLTFYGASLVVNFGFPLGVRAITNPAQVDVQ